MKEKTANTISWVLVIAYAVWPADLIPDVPGIGWLDDAGVIAGQGVLKSLLMKIPIL